MKCYYVCTEVRARNRDRSLWHRTVPGINRPGENAAPSKHWEQELVQKEGKHRPKAAVEHQQFEVCNSDKFVYK